jgi:hypothetical protein
MRRNGDFWMWNNLNRHGIGRELVAWAIDWCQLDLITLSPEMDEQSRNTVY